MSLQKILYIYARKCHFLDNKTCVSAKEALYLFERALYLCKSTPMSPMSLASLTATHCNTLQHTATHCNALQRTATHCNTLQRTATHCNTLQHTATHCNTLQHTATHCNTLQHTATHQFDLRVEFAGIFGEFFGPSMKNVAQCMLMICFYSQV